MNMGNFSHCVGNIIVLVVSPNGSFHVKDLLLINPYIMLKEHPLYEL